MIVLTVIAMMTMYPVITHAELLHETLHLKTHGNNTLLTIVFKPLSIGSYGYASVYLTYNGVYAYGVILLKPPGKPSEIYVMAGDQNHWYGPIIKDNLVGHTITVKILVIQNNTLYYNIDGSTGKCNLTYLPPLTTLHIVAGNITGRASPSPEIVFNKIAVYVTNNTLSGKTIDDIIIKGLIPATMILALNTTYTITHTTTTTTTTRTNTTTTTTTITPQTTTTTTPSPTTTTATSSPGILRVIAVVVAAASIVLILLMWRRQATRSGKS